MIIANESAFSNLATFENIDQLNETVRTYKRQLADELNKTELAVLDILHRYSAKYKGVSFLRKSKIGEMVSKSRRTIIRVCKRLESLGIVRQYEIARPTDKRQSSNAIVILPVSATSHRPNENRSTWNDVTPETSEKCHPSKTTSSVKQLHKDTKERTKDRPFKPAWIPSSFFDIMNSHIDSLKEIEEYWRAVYAITYPMGLTKETKEAIAIESFMEMKSRRKKLQKPIAYFIGVVKRKAALQWGNIFAEVIG